MLIMISPTKIDGLIDPEQQRLIVLRRMMLNNPNLLLDSLHGTFRLLIPCGGPSRSWASNCTTSIRRLRVDGYSKAQIPQTDERSRRHSSSFLEQACLSRVFTYKISSTRCRTKPLRFGDLASMGAGGSPDKHADVLTTPSWGRTVKTNKLLTMKLAQTFPCVGLENTPAWL